MSKSLLKKRRMVRVNLEVTEEVRDHMKDLQSRSNAASMSEVFKRAMALYDLILSNSTEGGKTVLISPNGEEEVVRFL